MAAIIEGLDEPLKKEVVLILSTGDGYDRIIYGVYRDRNVLLADVEKYGIKDHFIMEFTLDEIDRSFVDEKRNA